MLSPNVCIPFDGNHASIPSAFSRVTAGDGKFLKGWGAENPGDTGGSSTHTHTFTDAHTMVDHTHTFSTNGAYDNGSGFNDEGAGGDKGMSDNHTHTGTTNNPSNGSISEQFTTGSASNLPPYYDVIFIKAGQYTALPPNGIVFRSSSSRPGLTQHTSGNSRFYRGADTAQNAGATGGSLTHTHTVNHSPAAVNHNHTATTNLATGTDGSNNSNGNSARTHSHTFTWANSSGDTPNSYSGSMGSADTVQPLYKTLAAFKNTGSSSVPLRMGDIAFLADGSDVPIGWVACDGTNNTPDMRDYHLKNYAGTSTTNDGSGVGSNSHGHTAANSHSHTATATHSHANTSTGGNNNTPGYTDGAGAVHVAPDGHTHTASMTQSQTSSWNANTITLDTNANTQPPYLVVKFIMFQFSSSGSAFAALRRMRG